MSPTDQRPGDRLPRDPGEAEGPSVPLWCGRCGEALAEGDHTACERLLALEPPRYCPRCRRRMKVQVVPGGWSAVCGEHGRTERATWRS